MILESVFTHDAADDRGLLGYEDVLTIALVQYTWWREDINRSYREQMAHYCINNVSTHELQCLKQQCFSLIEP